MLCKDIGRSRHTMSRAGSGSSGLAIPTKEKAGPVQADNFKGSGAPGCATSIIADAVPRYTSDRDDGELSECTPSKTGRGRPGQDIPSTGSRIVMVDGTFFGDYFEQDRSWDDSGITISGIWGTHQNSIRVRMPVLIVAPRVHKKFCLLYTSPSPRDGLLSRMPSSA